jgi:PrtD family type I secretion system ABC transporter
VTNALKDSLSRCRRGLVAVAGFSMVINLLMLTVPLFMLQVFDRVLTSQSTQTLLYLSLIAVGALILLGLFELMRSRVLVRIGSWVDRVLSPIVFKRGLDNALVGSAYRTEALRDVGVLRGFLGGGGIMALFDSPWVPIYILVIWLLHPMLGAFALAGAVALFVLALVNHLLTHRKLAEANAAASKNFRGAESAFRNAEVIDGMAMGSALARRWDAGNARILALQAGASDHAGTLAAMTKSFRLMLQVGILGLGAWYVLQAQLTPGGMIAASIILGRALAPVEQAIGAWKQMMGAREAWRRLSELFARPPLHPDAMPLPRPRGQLAVENVSWSPPGMRVPIIKAVSLALEPGEVLAVIGPSAAGKSTLARLMVGIGQPQIGRVRLDGADVFSLSRDSFGDYVGYLPQDVELFPGTIRENIARMEDGDPDKVVAAARMAGVHDMILRLADGYDTDIGDQGALLSGGQRQRIGLARALYGGPALLVLDEPNSNLDSTGEEALNSAIAAAKENGTTVVLVAHRPSMMAHVDKIAVLNAGQLQSFGPRDEVLAQMRPRAVPRAGQPPVRVVAQQAE